MDDIKQLKKMVQSVINGQSAIKADLTVKMEKGFKDVNSRISNLENETRKGFKDVNSRIDSLGKQLNELDEDTPTEEEFKQIEQRVTNLENNNFVTA